MPGKICPALRRPLTGRPCPPLRSQRAFGIPGLSIADTATRELVRQRIAVHRGCGFNGGDMRRHGRAGWPCQQNRSTGLRPAGGPAARVTGALFRDGGWGVDSRAKMTHHGLPGAAPMVICVPVTASFPAFYCTNARARNPSASTAGRSAFRDSRCIGPVHKQLVIIVTDREDFLSGIHNDESRDVASWYDFTLSKKSSSKTN